MPGAISLRLSGTVKMPATMGSKELGGFVEKEDG